MATPIFCCGFECGVLSGNAHFNILVGTAVSFSTTTKRSGERAIRFNPTAATAAISNQPSPYFTASSIYVARFYVYFSSLPTADTNLYSFGGSAAGVWFKSSDSKIYAGYNGPVYGTTGVAVTTGVWYRIDCRVNATNNPWTIDVQVDGAACAQLTNPAGSTSPNTNNFGILVNACTADIYIDDIIISQTAADYPLGAGYVNHFIPTSDGTHNVAGANDFERTLTGTDIDNTTTTAYQLIDDVPLKSVISDFINQVLPVNTSDYVECVLGPAPGISTPTVLPRSIDVLIAIHQASTATGAMKVALLNSDNTDSGDIYHVSAGAGTTTLAYKRVKRTVPSTLAKFNGTKVRFGPSTTTVDANPDQYLDGVMMEAEFAAVPTGFTLTAATGAFSETGIAAGLRAARTIAMAVATFALSGNNATFVKGYRMPTTTQEYNLTGNTTNFPITRKLTADVRTYALNGVNANTLYGRKMPATQQSFSLTGINANTLFGRKVIATFGAYLLTGNTTGLATQRKLTADVRTYALTGIATNFIKGYRITSTVGSFSFTGINAGVLAQRKILATQQTYSLTGITSNVKADRKLTATLQTYAITGNAANTLKGFRVINNTGSFTLTGVNTLLTAQRKLTATQQTYSLNGIAVTFLKGFTLTASTQAYSLTGVNNNMLYARRVSMSPGSFALTGNNAGVFFGRKIIAAQANFTLTGNAANVLVSRKVSVNTGTYAFTGNASNLLAARRISGTVRTYSLTGINATLTYNPASSYTLSADSRSYVLNGINIGFIAQRKITAAGATYSLIGSINNLIAARRLAMATGSFLLTGANINAIASRKIVANTRSYILTGQALNALAGRKLIATSRNYALVFIDGNLIYVPNVGGFTLEANTGNFILTGINAGFIGTRKISGATGLFVLTGISSNLLRAGLVYKVEFLKKDSLFTGSVKHGSYIPTAAMLESAIVTNLLRSSKIYDNYGESNI